MAKWILEINRRPFPWVDSRVEKYRRMLGREDKEEAEPLKSED